MLEFSIDQPRPGAASLVNGWLEVSGWAAGTEQVTAIQVSIGQGQPSRAFYGGGRSDVVAAHPDYHSARYSGFRGYVPVSGSCGKSVILKVEVLGSAGARLSAELALDIASNTQLPATNSGPDCPGCKTPWSAPQARFQRGPYQLHVCGTCGLGFVYPLPTVEYLKHYYDEAYWHVASQRPRSSAEHYDSDFIANVIRRYNPASKRVMEIGCGPGTLLAGLHRRGFEVRGQDLSSEAAAIAKDVFRLDVRVAPLSDLPSWPCDAIVLRHMIEHSPSPCDGLEQATLMLNPGGLLVVITPNLQSLAAQLLGAAWEWFVPPAHLFYFSPSSLAHFGQRRRLEIRHITTRRGDGLLPAPTLAAYLAYERSHLAAWEIERVEKALALLESGSGADPALASLGIGNEVIAVFSRPPA